MTKATHSGHCQACGRLQKLPKGVLSLHGYNVTHGFFAGTCVGARELPFEKSCALIVRFIASAMAQLERLEAFQADLRKPATEPKAWVRNYEGREYGRNGYEWREVAVQSDLREYTGRLLDGKPADTHSWREYFYIANGTNGAKDVRHKIESHAYHSPTDFALLLATDLNRKYAAWLDREANDLKRYIDWQRERVRTWKEAPLLPVEAKDKEGFQPTEVQ